MKNIPVLHVEGESIAEVWENSLKELWMNGIKIKTMYDKPNDPPSLDCTMVLCIKNPLSEPMIHKDMPMGVEDLQEYVMEVCDGIKDHWIRKTDDPTDTKWQYTYHQRLFSYVCEKDSLIIDQIESVCQQIAKTPFTRRAQAVTWKVWEDPNCYDPACLQSIHCRCLEDDDGSQTLNYNVRFRSNDAYKAAQLNMFAITMLASRMAKRIEDLSGKKTVVGRYMHMADSYHLYGSYMEEFKNRFLKNLKDKTFEDRSINYCDVKDMMDEAIPMILKKVKEANI